MRQRSGRQLRRKDYPVSDLQQSRSVQGSAPPGGDASISDLINNATTQISTLVRDELALAKLELTEKGKRAGLGGGLFGAAGLLGVYGLGLLLALVVVALDILWPTWLAVLVMMVVVFVAAGVAALVGKNEFKRAVPPTPNAAIAGVEADVATIKDAVRDGRKS
jgi:hypothetical protein